MPVDISADDLAKIEDLMEFHKGNQNLIAWARKTLLTLFEGAPECDKLIHSFRARAKSDESMRHKLRRKIERARSHGEDFGITRENFYSRINDAIGLRLIHLSVTQFPEIHGVIERLLRMGQYIQLETPKAEVFDIETQQYFQNLGVTVNVNPRLYSSVHYVVAPNSSVAWSAEIQVRTLAQEAWGEVDHKFNYPDPHPTLACREQIKVLAHVANAASRSVTAIFNTVAEGRPESK